jgi:hypothetical protein
MKEKKDNLGAFQHGKLNLELPYDLPFTVPNDYFESLEEKILFRAQMVEESGELHAGFTIKPAYFEELEDSILARTKEFELKQQVDRDGYSVPANYFEELEANILERTVSKSKQKTLIRRLIGENGMKYAAAACVLIASVFLIRNSLQEQQLTLKDIPDQEIIQYLQMYGNTQDGYVLREYVNAESDFNEIGSDFSDADLEWYLNNTL